MAGNLARLRSQVELALAGRVTAPFTYRDRNFAEHVSTGISEIDLLAGGLPRGALTEIFGPDCSGRTSLLFSALSVRTAHLEACALIDGCDAFDPHSAEAAGVDLKQLLWVRCRNIQQTLGATDLLLQSGGFGFIALDLSDVSREVMRHVPLDAWFRFRRAVEDTQTILVVLEQESNAKTCASLVLHLKGEPGHWATTLQAPAGKRDAEISRDPFSQDAFSQNTFSQGALSRHAISQLLSGFDIRAEVLRSRVQPVVRTTFRDGLAAVNASGKSGIFETHATWNYFSGIEDELKPK
jgi:recombination protein RecA